MPDPTSLTSLPEEDEEPLLNRPPTEETEAESGKAKSLFFGVPKETACPFKHDYYYNGDTQKHGKYCLCDCEWCKQKRAEYVPEPKVYVP